MPQWYEELFTDYARTYDQEKFTQGTAQEVEFIINELEHDSTRRILDIGCGTGRHAIELARRGYGVTGVDLSPSQIQRAREKADAAGVQVAFQVADARSLDYFESFDAVLMLCEGGFSLMESDEMNFQILSHAVKALKSGGKFIFTTLNALFPLNHSTQTFMAENLVEGESADHHFDPMTFRDYSTFTVTDDHGNKKTLQCNERYFAPSEITWYLRTLNCPTVEIFGCDIGDFRRDVPLTADHFEMLVVAVKKSLE